MVFTQWPVFQWLSSLFSLKVTPVHMLSNNNKPCGKERPMQYCFWISFCDEMGLTSAWTDINLIIDYRSFSETLCVHWSHRSLATAWLTAERHLTQSPIIIINIMAPWLLFDKLRGRLSTISNPAFRVHQFFFVHVWV